MKAHLEQKPFKDLHFEYHEFALETHNSEVPVAFTKILPRLKLE
jgi:hypothetical protein